MGLRGGFLARSLGWHRRGLLVAVVAGSLGSALERWLRTEYWPAHQPWYDGAVWGNVFVIPVVFVLGVIVWPPFRKAILGAFRRETSELHRKLDWVI